MIKKAGKNKKSTILYNDIAVDSLEEWHTFCWLDEAKELGIVKSYEYQPDEFKICQPVRYTPAFNNKKKTDRALLQKHVYTTDFKIVFNAEYGEYLSKAFKISEAVLDADGTTFTVYIDVKGGFNRFGGDRLFSIHQKLVYEKFNIFIDKFVPKVAFKHLGIAKASLKTPTGRSSRIFADYYLLTTKAVKT